MAIDGESAILKPKMMFQGALRVVLRRVRQKYKGSVRPGLYRFLGVVFTFSAGAFIFARRIFKRKIPITYLVSQVELFQAEGFLQELSRDSRFDVRVIIFPNFENSSLSPSESVLTQLNDLRFSGLALTSVCASQPSDLPSPLRVIRPGGLIFVDQPHQNLGRKWRPFSLAPFWLLAYVPYGFKVSPGFSNNFSLPFFSLLWRIFAESDWHSNQFLSANVARPRHIFSLGYPKMDRFKMANIDTASQGSERAKIIWAPHWSVRDETLGYGTFEWSYPAMFEIAREYPMIHWIFKPHQRLSQQVISSGLMSASEWRKFLQDWESLENGSVLFGSGYIEAFDESVALITDSGSFLGEYTFTTKPILLLKSDSSQGYNETGQRIALANYVASSPSDIQTFLTEIVIGGRDTLKNNRSALREDLFPSEKFPVWEKIAANISLGLSNRPRLTRAAGSLRLWLTRKLTRKAF